MAPVPRSGAFVGEIFEIDSGEEGLDDCKPDEEGLSEVVEGVDEAIDVTRDASEMDV